MVPEALFQTIPFPCRVQSMDPYGLIFESKNSFFDSACDEDENSKFWPTINNEGWRQCNLGYSVYVRKIPGMPKLLLVLHSLKIKGNWKSRGKDERLSIVVSQDKVVSYVNNFLSSLKSQAKATQEAIETKVQSLVTESVHEIRSMNSSLYHAAFELQDQLQYDSSHKLALAKNVVALSELISSRIELADLVASGSEHIEGEYAAPVAVFKKFEKIVKCYIAYAKRREISIWIDGASHGLTQGISNFEMIPLIVVDNAVKYSPPKKNISIDFSEDNFTIKCTITSLGPKIEEGEKLRIFEKEFRGIHAKSSGQGGSGIGLNFAHRLMNFIGGSISFEQDYSAQRFNGKNYFETKFCLEFEKHVSEKRVALE